MATLYSEQMRNTRSKPTIQNGSYDNADLRQIAFDFIPRDEAPSNVIVFGELKRGWRLWGMRIVTLDNISIVGGAVTFGIAGNATKYSGSIAWDVNAQDISVAFNNTIALNYGELLTADAELIGTANGVDLWHAPSRAIVTVSYTR